MGGGVGRIDKFTWQPNSGNTKLLAEWTPVTSSKPVKSLVSKTDKYTVEWDYYVDSGKKKGNVWVVGGRETTESRQTSIDIPDGALKVRIRVKPVPKTKKVNKETVNEYSAKFSGWKPFNTSSVTIGTADTPTVALNGTKLDISLNNIDTTELQTKKVTHVCFNIYANGKSAESKVIQIAARRAATTYATTSGNSYTVRAQLWNGQKGAIKGPWSDFSDPVYGVPAAPGKPTASIIQDPNDGTSIKVTWTKAAGAKTYELQWVTDNLDGAYSWNQSTVQSQTGIEALEWYVNGQLETGKYYYFRVRAANRDGANGGWSEISAAIAVSKPPNPPTVWTDQGTYNDGNKVNMHFIHNGRDASIVADATIYVAFDGLSSSYTSVFPSNTVFGNGYAEVIASKIKNTEHKIFEYSAPTEDTNYTTGYFAFDTSKVPAEVSEVRWKIKTKGLDPNYGDYSAENKFKLYSVPEISASTNLTDEGVLSSFPFTITVQNVTSDQVPISLGVTISTAGEAFYAYNRLGEYVYMPTGTEVLSKLYLWPSGAQTSEVTISPGEAVFESGQAYTVKITAAMNSGLTANYALDFTAEFGDASYYYDLIGTYYEDEYILALNAFALNNPGDVDDEETPLEFDDPTNYPEDVVFDIYRREFDGGLSLVASNVPNNTTIIDSHCQLNSATYRMVAINKTSGHIDFYDPDGIPVNEPKVVIQWDETWSEFEPIEEEPVEKPWSGTLLALPYNIDVSESNTIDVSRVEYIGRKHPVSYFGTQVGQKAQWKVDIPAYDYETLQLLRRLSVWMGNVYVREPSGVGYFATISVSMQQTHRSPVIPVTLDVIRVEGNESVDYAVMVQNTDNE